MMTTRSVLRQAALAVVTGLALSACTSRPLPGHAEVDAPLPVTVARVAMADVADTFEAGGVVQARTSATIMARILAPVREVRVAPGDRVRAGQALIALDGRDLGAHARSARAAAQAADQNAAAAASEQQAAAAALVLARATQERMAGLHAKRSATAQELDDATAALRVAEARAAGAASRAQAAMSGVESARAASEATDATEGFALITAPFDGVVTEKMVEPGDMAAPGTPLLRVEDTRAFRLEVRVDESRVGRIALGARVPIALDLGTGADAAVVSGTVAEIGRAVDADTRAFLVKIALPEADGLRSGAFGRARFSMPTRRALTVPDAAIARRGQMTSVFVVEQGVARARLVDLRGTEVLAGLSEADVVILAPPSTMTDGRHVAEGVR